MPKTTILPHHTMTIEEKNELIAERNGFVFDKRGIWHNKSKGIFTVKLPNYFLDLNEVQQAETTLDSIALGRHHWSLHLLWMLPQEARDAPLHYETWKMIAGIAKLTAAQRAEALGLALGLWQPGE